MAAAGSGLALQGATRGRERRGWRAEEVRSQADDGGNVAIGDEADAVIVENANMRHGNVNASEITNGLAMGRTRAVTMEGGGPTENSRANAASISSCSTVKRRRTREFDVALGAAPSRRRPQTRPETCAERGHGERARARIA